MVSDLTKSRLLLVHRNWNGFIFQTSSLSVNRSITQKPKVYTFSPLGHVNFTVVFKSEINASRQLNYEPKDVAQFLEIRMRLLARVRTELKDAQYWFTYVRFKSWFGLPEQFIDDIVVPPLLASRHQIQKLICKKT